MIGHHLVNYDNKKISYDFNTAVPFVGQFTLTRSHIETALKYLDGTKQNMTQLSTTQLDGIRIREFDFAEVPALIKKIQTFLEDLQELQKKIDADPKPVG